MKSKLSQGAHTLPYQAVKLLKEGDKPKAWDIRNIDPQLTEEETASAAVDYFNAISSEFCSLSYADIPQSWEKNYPHLLPHEVSRRLKKCRKPKSMIDGDIFPQLVTAFSDL